MASLSLRIMTLNIRFPSTSDEGNLWHERRSIAAELIGQIDADIIGMQETYRIQIADLLADVGGYACTGRERRAGTDEEHNPILVRASRFLIEASGTFWLAETPDMPGSRQWMPEDHPRVVTWARLEDLATGQRLLVLNTHFPLGSDELRGKCAALLWERLGRFEPMPTIVTGDFNATPDSLPHRLLTGSEALPDGSKADLADAWVTAPETLGPEATFHGFTGAAKRPDARIDWVLVRNGVAAKRIETVTFSRDGRYPADHFPVVADIEVSAAKEGL